MEFIVKMKDEEITIWPQMSQSYWYLAKQNYTINTHTHTNQSLNQSLGAIGKWCNKFIAKIMRGKVIHNLIQTLLSQSFCTHIFTRTKMCETKLDRVTGTWHRGQGLLVHTHLLNLFLLVFSQMNLSVCVSIQSSFKISAVDLCNAMVFCITEGQNMTNEEVTSCSW